VIWWVLEWFGGCWGGEWVLAVGLVGVGYSRWVLVVGLVGGTVVWQVLSDR
jgi:hypothetical protein